MELKLLISVFLCELDMIFSLYWLLSAFADALTDGHSSFPCFKPLLMWWWKTRQKQIIWARKERIFSTPRFCMNRSSHKNKLFHRTQIMLNCSIIADLLSIPLNAPVDTNWINFCETVLVLPMACWLVFDCCAIFWSAFIYLYLVLSECNKSRIILQQSVLPRDKKISSCFSSLS